MREEPEPGWDTRECARERKRGCEVLVKRMVMLLRTAVAVLSLGI